MPYPPRYGRVGGDDLYLEARFPESDALLLGPYPYVKVRVPYEAVTAAAAAARGPTQRGRRGDTLTLGAPHKIGIKLTRAQLCAAPATPRPRILPPAPALEFPPRVC